MIGDPQYVYFIRPVGMDGPIKIGFSIKPISRLQSSSTWSAFPLEMIGYVPGTSDDESFLHRCFACCHYHREWFHATPELLAAVRGILKHGITFAHENLKETGEIHGRPRTPETRARMSVSIKASWASRKKLDTAFRIKRGVSA